MNIPFAYLLGLAVVLLAHEAFPVLPGSGHVGVLVLTAPLLALPAILGWLAERRRRHAGIADRLARVLARAAPAMLPAVCLLVLVPGGWLDLLDRWSGESRLAGATLLLAPLFLAELARVVVGARAAAGNGEPPATRLRARLAFPCVFTLPWLLLGALGDLLVRQPALHAFVVASSVGLTAAAMLFVVAMGVLLPLLFRLLFDLRRDLPAAIADDVRGTALALGFPVARVRWLDTGMRHVNALLLGPLPWPRYLVLTDGLLATLDRQSLRGVVAHEVGHAQAGHPALLVAMFVLTPLLLMNVAQLFVADEVTLPLLAAAVALLVVGWRVLRRVAHRFEHEADVLSAIALGGAEPCINALQRVGQVVQQDVDRASMLHPSEGARVQLLRRFAAEPQFRAQFTLRGVRLRHAIVGLLMVAGLAAGWSWYRSWPCERAVQLFLLGDLAAARRQVEYATDTIPPARLQWWVDFGRELEAAVAIVGDGGDPEVLRPRLADEAWQRGLAVLRHEGAVAALPWLALATGDVERSPLRRSLHLWCEAARAHDTAGMQVLAAHIVRLPDAAAVADLLRP